MFHAALHHTAARQASVLLSFLFQSCIARKNVDSLIVYDMDFRFKSEATEPSINLRPEIQFTASWHISCYLDGTGMILLANSVLEHVIPAKAGIQLSYQSII